MKKFMVFLACLAAFAMVFGFTVTAAMADADLYGSIRFRTYWIDQDKAFTGYKATNTGFDDEDLDWRICPAGGSIIKAGTSKANWKWIPETLMGMKAAPNSAT